MTSYEPQPSRKKTSHARPRGRSCLILEGHSAASPNEPWPAFIARLGPVHEYQMEQWRTVSIPVWQEVLRQSLNQNDARRAKYAFWMLQEVLEADFGEQEERGAT